MAKTECEIIVKKEPGVGFTARVKGDKSGRVGVGRSMVLAVKALIEGIG